MKPPLSESENTAAVNVSIIALFVFSSASVTVNTAEPPAEALLVSKPASAILNATEADATNYAVSVLV